MGKIAALDARSLAWAREQFARYYAIARVEPPPRLARREFAGFPFATETMMRRHLALPTVEAFGEFLRSEVPRHAYYSSAYYRLPDHPKMDGKEWLGADLIFDLDADHLRGAERLHYAEQLALVKERVASLYDEFLVGDFGIDPAEMTLVFSGGRGYHVHIREPGYLPLTSPERRELVDYIQGSGFDATLAVREVRDDGGIASAAREAEEGGERPRSKSARSFKSLYPPETPGWRGRTTRSVLTLLARWEMQGPVATQSELQRRGLSEPKARSLAKLLLEKGRGRQIRESLSLEVFRREVPPEFFDIVLRQAAIEVQGETDAPVTTDINRLIRLPGSLHGGSGFRVTPLTRESVDRFDPLVDAVVPVPAGETRTVELADAVDYPFPRRVEGAAGDRVELPTPVALFLVLRGEAAVPP
ncbi:MAG: DNA primase small subunit PriS [Thermoplasmata archaeon]|nr:DNA primase small subunit PriS [Thermoplasmata archaeon]